MLTAFTNAMDDVFLVGLPFMAIALVIAIFMREVPLIGRAGPAPTQSSESDAELAPSMAH